MKRDALVSRVGGDKGMRRRGVALLAIAALMAGCSLIPSFHRPAAPIAAKFPSGDSYKYPATGPRLHG